MEYISEFCKLYKRIIPVHEHFDYYVDTMSRVDPSIIEQVEIFKDLVQEHDDPGRYKIKHALPTLVSYVRNTDAFKRLQEFELPKDSKLIPPKGFGKVPVEVPVISVDMVAANHTVFKLQDSNFQRSWNQLCDDFEIHEALKLSKRFRQVVYGTAIPKRTQLMQRVIMKQFMDAFESEFNVLPIVFSADELTYRVQDVPSDFMQVAEASGKLLGIDLKTEQYTLEKIPEGHVKIIKHGLETKRKLHGVPGNLYYKALKQHILEEELDERDLLFKHEKQIARWII